MASKLLTTNNLVAASLASDGALAQEQVPEDRSVARSPQFDSLKICNLTDVQ